MNNDYNNRIRIKSIGVLFVGSVACGKSCLIQNYFGQQLTDDYYLSSIYSDYYSKKIQFEDLDYNIKIIDYPGTERYKSIIYSNLRFSKIIVLVFDMTKKDSFLYLDRLLESFSEEVDINKYMFILIGNKADLRDKWEIKEKDAKEFANIIHAKFILTSAKNEPKILQEFLDNAFCDYIKISNQRLDEQPNQGRQHNIILNRANRRRHRSLCG